MNAPRHATSRRPRTATWLLFAAWMALGCTGARTVAMVPPPSQPQDAVAQAVTPEAPPESALDVTDIWVMNSDSLSPPPPATQDQDLRQETQQDAFCPPPDKSASPYGDGDGRRWQSASPPGRIAHWSKNSPVRAGKGGSGSGQQDFFAAFDNLSLSCALTVDNSLDEAQRPAAERKAMYKAVRSELPALFSIQRRSPVKDQASIIARTLFHVMKIAEQAGDGEEADFWLLCVGEYALEVGDLKQTLGAIGVLWSRLGDSNPEVPLAYCQQLATRARGKANCELLEQEFTMLELLRRRGEAEFLDDALLVGLLNAMRGADCMNDAAWSRWDELNRGRAWPQDSLRLALTRLQDEADALDSSAPDSIRLDVEDRLTNVLCACETRESWGEVLAELIRQVGQRGDAKLKVELMKRRVDAGFEEDQDEIAMQEGINQFVDAIQRLQQGDPLGEVRRDLEQAARRWPVLEARALSELAFHFQLSDPEPVLELAQRALDEYRRLPDPLPIQALPFYPDDFAPTLRDLMAEQWLRMPQLSWGARRSWQLELDRPQQETRP